jgi:hypothetical protein
VGQNSRHFGPLTQSEPAEEYLKLRMEPAPRTRLEVLDFMRDEQIAKRTLKRTLSLLFLLAM